MIKIDIDANRHFWLDGILKKQLDTIIYNINNGFDFLIIITGTGLTRVGKTTLAQQIGFYVASKLGTPFTNENVVFGGADLMTKAGELPHKSVIVDDESREDISAKSQMDFFNKQLITFFNECGMYNHLIILVATDFFDFCKSIALTRAELLINCIRTSKPAIDPDGNEVVELGRGWYELYDRTGKKRLYREGKKDYDTYLSKYRFAYGEFRDYWVIDKEQYEIKKLEFLKRNRMKRSETRKISYVCKGLHDQGWTNIKIGELIHANRLEVKRYMDMANDI